MPTREDRGKDLLDHRMLADEAALDAAACLGQTCGQNLHIGYQFMILGHDNVPILIYHNINDSRGGVHKEWRKRVTIL